MRSPARALSVAALQLRVRRGDRSQDRRSQKYAKPVVCNEDDKVGARGVQAAEASVAHGASWGLMLRDLNQRYPFTVKGAADDPLIYAKLRELTTREKLKQ